MSPKVKKRLICITAAFVVVLLYIYGFSMRTVHYTVKTDKLDTKIRIVFISDLHNCIFGGFDQSGLMDAIDEENPDMVLFGGDVIDGWSGDKDALKIMGMVSEKYPCAYAPGNHEEMHEDAEDFYKKVEKAGVPVLRGDKESFTIKGQKIAVFGAIENLYPMPDGNTEPYNSQLEACIAKTDSSEYNILLAHQPEQIDSLLEGDFDLILSGHAHGGQWRIPKILDQGLYAPDQGLFPKYTNGQYHYGKTDHIISVGLARPARMFFIPRIFNRPELSVIDIG